MTRFRPKSWLSIIMLFWICSAQANTLQQAFVGSGENGQAILLNSHDQCFAVLPKHVIGNNVSANFIGSTPVSIKGQGELSQVFGYDLAVMQVDGALTNNCGDDFMDFIDYSIDAELKANPTAVVSSIYEDGSIKRSAVVITDIGLIYFRISSLQKDFTFQQGMSGSLVQAGNKNVGTLMSVDADSGEGIVLRLDRTLETLTPFFDSLNEIESYQAISVEPENLLINASFTKPYSEGWFRSDGKMGNAYRRIDTQDGALSLSFTGIGNGEAQLSLDQKIAVNKQNLKNILFTSQISLKSRSGKDFAYILLELQDDKDKAIASLVWTDDIYYEGSASTLMQALAWGKENHIEFSIYQRLLGMISDRNLAKVSHITLKI